MPVLHAPCIAMYVGHSLLVLENWFTRDYWSDRLCKDVDLDKPLQLTS